MLAAMHFCIVLSCWCEFIPSSVSCCRHYCFQSWLPLLFLESPLLFFRFGLNKIHLLFLKAGLYSNYLISSESKQKTWYHKSLLNAEFPHCGIQNSSVGFRKFGDSNIPQPIVGLPHFCLKSIGPPVLNPPFVCLFSYFFWVFFGIIKYVG